MKFNYEIDGEKTAIDISNEDNRFKLSIEERSREFTVKKVRNKNYIIVADDGKVYDVFVDGREDGSIVFLKVTDLKLKTVIWQERGVGLRLTVK